MKKIIIISAFSLILTACLSLSGGSNLLKTAYFNEFGITMEKEPDYKTSGQTEMIIASEKEMDLFILLLEENTNRAYETFQVEEIEKGKKWRISVFFPKSGDYSMDISAKISSGGETSYFSLVHMAFFAEVEQGSTAAVQAEKLLAEAAAKEKTDLFVLDKSISETNKSLEIEDIKVVNEPWYINMRLSKKEYKTGRLKENFELLYNGVTLTLGKGAEVSFIDSDNRIIYLSFNLENSTDMQFGDFTVPLKAGGKFVLGLFTRVYLTENYDLAMVDNILRLPKGSNIIFYTKYDEIDEINLNGTGEYLVDGKSYPFWSVAYVNISEGVPALDLITSREIEFQQGNVSCTIPANANFYFYGNFADSFYIMEDLEIMVDGKKMPVEVGGAVVFDDSGNFKEISFK